MLKKGGVAMKQTDLLIVNGMRFPCPMHGISVTSTQAVSAGRNTNGAAVGQLVGRRMYKLNNLQWNGLSVEMWARMRASIEPFYVTVTFTDDCNVRRTVTMFPGDTNAEPLFAKDIFYTQHKTCKFNLIDCGYE